MAGLYSCILIQLAYTRDKYSFVHDIAFSYSELLCNDENVIKIITQVAIMCENGLTTKPKSMHENMTSTLFVVK